jgi:hypothetical protein
LRTEPLRGPRQVELDHLRRARADEKQHLDFGAAFQQPLNDLVEFVIGVSQPCQIAVVDDGGGESRLGKNHHAGSGLHEMCTGS